MNKEFWNNRFAFSEYAYSEKANPFIKKCIDQLPPQSRLLFPAEGEGRNAVYAASQGHDVFAFDMSVRALEKSKRLAQKHEVQINYNLGTLEEMDYDEGSFDGIALGYFHLPPEIRVDGYRKIQHWLKKGGNLFFEFFHKDQIHLNSGGPRRIDMLYDEELLREDFDQIRFDELRTEKLILDEGKYHQGPAVVIHGWGSKE